MTVSRTDRVLELKGLNSDGEELIEGYSYQGKNREAAADELVERAIDMGYLSDATQSPSRCAVTTQNGRPEKRLRSGPSWRSGMERAL